MDEELEKRIRKIVDEASHRYLGVGIDRLSEDLSARLVHQHIPYDIDINTDYRSAKKAFRKALITRLLVINLGNISETAKALQVDRRTLHRMITDLEIDIKRIKNELSKPYNIRLCEVSTDISRILDRYKEIIHPTKLEEMYRNVDEISKTLVTALPASWPPLKAAEDEFEAMYLRKMMLRYPEKSSAARMMGIRHETLVRKTKALR